LSNTPGPTRTLTSWKEIAAYLGKGVRTVQRWEQELGLPVRRPIPLNRGMVVATPQDLDLWLRQRWAKRPNARSGENHGDYKMSPEVQASQALLRANRDIVQELLQNVKRLQEECENLAKSTPRFQPTGRRRT
jgi:hypothetical protein